MPRTPSPAAGSGLPEERQMPGNPANEEAPRRGAVEGHTASGPEIQDPLSARHRGARDVPENTASEEVSLPGNPAMKTIGSNLGSANIVRFPIERLAEKFEIDGQEWHHALPIIIVMQGFAMADDQELDAMMKRTHEARPDDLSYILRESGEIVEMLRRVSGFMGLIDRRLQASVERALQAGGL